jgi:soluble lytic murein transglycosylase-like protein
MFKKIVQIRFLSLVLLSLSAQSKSADIVYKYKSKNGTPSFSDMKPIGVKYEIAKIGCFACEVKSHINWHKAKLYVGKYHKEINHAAYIHRVSPSLVRAVIHAESHFNPTALSHQGAQGLMQLMPATAKELGVEDAFIAVENINGGVKYLAKLLKRFDGNVRLATAAYNAGPGAVRRYGGMPPYPETQVYVERVDILRKRYRDEG